MRRTLAGWIAAIMLLSAPSLAAPPAPTDSQAAADFFLATCRDSSHNLDAVAKMAAQRNWVAMLMPNVPLNDPVQVKGMWKVADHGRAYTVTIGTGPRNSTTCMVIFADPRPRRDDLFAAVAKTLKLKPRADTPGSEWRSEMYQVQDLLPANAILQIVSSGGNAYSVAIMGN